MHLTTEQVRTQTFEQSRSGYDPTDVRTFLDDTASQMSNLANEVDDSHRDSAGTALVNSMFGAVFGQARKGFSPAKVDDFIDRLAQQIHEQTGSTTSIQLGLSARLKAARPPSVSWWQRLTGG